MVLKSKGFTLVELMIVMVIIVLLMIIAIGALNPRAMRGRANDAQRKSDLSRFKVAFEEYYNDKNCYPNRVTIAEMNKQSNCGKPVFNPWLPSWLCDPQTREPYIVVVPDVSCPNQFSIFTKLENDKDNDIPATWTALSQVHTLDGVISASQINYGVSSSNIAWYETLYLPSECYGGFGGSCYTKTVEGTFTPINDNQEHYNAYTRGSDSCLVSCCIQGVACP